MFGIPRIYPKAVNFYTACSLKSAICPKAPQVAPQSMAHEILVQEWYIGMQFVLKLVVSDHDQRARKGSVSERMRVAGKRRRGDVEFFLLKCVLHIR